MNKNLFRSLHWKLTLTYTLVTTAALLTVGLLSLALFPAGLQPRSLLTQVVVGLGAGWANTPLVQQALSVTPPNSASLQEMLDDLPEWYQSPLLDTATLTANPLRPPTGLFVAITTGDGHLTATLPPLADHSHHGQSLIHLAPNLSPLLDTALDGESALDDSQPDLMQVAEPILDAQGQVLGAVIVIGDVNVLARQSTMLILAVAGSMLLIFTLASAGVGTLFGFIATRGITRRLTRMAQASAAWREGDFSINVTDDSQDELGQLANDLNHMAGDLRDLLQTRQELAALEERNRIARDLHDSIKQQAFAISAQVSAARALVSRDAAGAETRLQEAEKLSNQLRQELSLLVRELYAADVLGQGLPGALHALTADWGRQNHIPVQTDIEDFPIPDANALALYRVAQEALANIARHAKADHVKVSLTQNGERATLRIIDNGQGFDLQTIQKGIGLRSMRERMEALGGALNIVSAPEQGTAITAQV